MIQAKCILKIRDKHGKITGYKLQDDSGYTKDVYPEQLKQAIHTKRIEITNLTLTSDYRLVDKNDSDKALDIVKKARVLGCNIIELQAEYGRKFYLIETDRVTNSYKICIPNDVTRAYIHNGIWQSFNNSNINVEVIGGKGLTSGKQMFDELYIGTLDLSKFDTSNMTDMTSMFENSKFENLILTNLNTSKVKSMNYMFRETKVQSVDNKIRFIDISSFDTTNVETMVQMFDSARLLTDFSVINTCNVVNMSAMFKGYRCNILNLNHFSLDKCMTICGMFQKAYIKDLILSDWRIPNNCFAMDIFLNFRGVAHIKDKRLIRELKIRG